MGITPNFLEASSYNFAISEKVSPPATVQEGEPFSSPVTIKLSYTNGSAVSGILCIAYVYSYENQEYQLGYRYKLNGGRTKDVEYGISANFKPRDNSLFDQYNSIDYSYTNSTGYVSFPFLRYSVYGYAGSYKLIYTCAGSKMLSSSTTVTTSITSLTFATTPVTSFNMYNPREVDYHIMFRVLALNAQNLGVQGKVATTVTIFSQS